MLKNTVKLAGTIAKAAKTKAPIDVIKAGSESLELVQKMAKKKKKDEDKRKQRARR